MKRTIISGPADMVRFTHPTRLPDKEDPEHKSHPIYLGAWRVGDVYLFGSQCEICSNIGLRIKRELAGTRVWTNGYTHWGGGYVPDAASYPEEGYEVNRAVVSPTAEDVLVASAIRYVKTLQAGKTGHGPIGRPDEQWGHLSSDRPASDMAIHTTQALRSPSLCVLR